MPTPSPTIITLLSSFAIAFTASTFRNALVLVFGTILAPGRRTVAAALRAMGFADDEHFTNYYRVLNRAKWSAFVVSKILLTLIIRICLSETDPLLLVIDETLERRQGPKITYKSWFRDPIRSTAKKVNYALGIRWIRLCRDNYRIRAVEPTALGLTIHDHPSVVTKNQQKAGKATPNACWLG